jgi:hypothetical protein
MQKTTATNRDLLSRLTPKGVYCDGYGVCPKYPLIDPDLSTVSKALYSLLCSFLNGKDEQRKVFPKIKTLMKMMGIQKSETLAKYLRELISNGYITIEKGFPEGISRKGFVRNIYILQNKPAKFFSKPSHSKHAEHYKNIRKHGLFPKKGQFIPKSERTGLGYGLIPRALWNDPRLGKNSKIIYVYFCVHATENNDFKDMGRVARLTLNQILREVGISENTYRNHYDALCVLNYVTAYQPHKNGRFERCFFVLNSRPDMAKSSKKIILVSKDSEGKKRIKTLRKPAPPIGVVSPKLASKFSYADTPECYKRHDSENDYLHNEVVPTLKLADISNVEALFENNPSVYHDVIQQAGRELLQHGKIPYECSGNRPLTTAFVHYLTNFYEEVNSFKSNDYETQMFIMFTRALADLLCNGLKNPKISKPYATFIDQLNSDFTVTDKKSYISLDKRLFEKVLGIFTVAEHRAREVEGAPIEHPRNYLRTVINTALEAGKYGLNV